MAGYIERAAAIDAVSEVYYDTPDVNLSAENFEAAINAIPAADVAPVVRCKDCKYGDYDSKPDGAMVCLRTKDGFWRKETDFCSYGERMRQVTMDGGNENDP